MSPFLFVVVGSPVAGGGTTRRKGMPPEYTLHGWMSITKREEGHFFSAERYQEPSQQCRGMSLRAERSNLPRGSLRLLRRCAPRKDIRCFEIASKSVALQELRQRGRREKHRDGMAAPRARRSVRRKEAEPGWPCDSWAGRPCYGSRATRRGAGIVLRGGGGMWYKTGGIGCEGGTHTARWVGRSWVLGRHGRPGWNVSRHTRGPRGRGLHF